MINLGKEIPGPGSYNTLLNLGKSNPKFSMPGRAKLNYSTIVPSPAQYSPDYNRSNKLKSPIFSYCVV